MPEGDTILRAARTLNQALAGRVVTRFEAKLAPLAEIDRDTPIAGQTVEEVSARAKHLLMAFSGGLVLRTHMRMNGSWHIYRPGEKWRRAGTDARIVLETDAFVAVAFNVHEAEFIRAERLDHHPRLARLGPDVLSEAFDEDEVLRRIRARGGETLADLLLDQRVLSGLGNVYKSEALFAARLHPFARASSVSDEDLRRLVEIARRFIRMNVRAGSDAGIATRGTLRQTTRRSDPSERLWVYGRVGKPCRECGEPIVLERHGTGARSAYFCSHCQTT